MHTAYGVVWICSAIYYVYNKYTIVDSSAFEGAAVKTEIYKGRPGKEAPKKGVSPEGKLDGTAVI